MRTGREHPPKDNLTVTETGYEVRLPEAINPAYAQREIAKQLAALKALEARACGKIRITTSVDEIEKARHDHSFAIVIHMEGAESLGPDLHQLDELYEAGLRSMGLVWSRPNIFGHGVSLGKAIEGLKPSADAKAETKKAKHQATMASRNVRVPDKGEFFFIATRQRDSSA